MPLQWERTPGERRGGRPGQMESKSCLERPSRWRLQAVEMLETFIIDELRRRDRRRDEVEMPLPEPRLEHQAAACHMCVPQLGLVRGIPRDREAARSGERCGLT